MPRRRPQFSTFMEKKIFLLSLGGGDFFGGEKFFSKLTKQIGGGNFQIREAKGPFPPPKKITFLIHEKSIFREAKILSHRRRKGVPFNNWAGASKNQKILKSSKNLQKKREKTQFLLNFFNFSKILLFLKKLWCIIWLESCCGLCDFDKFWFKKSQNFEKSQKQPQI